MMYISYSSSNTYAPHTTISIVSLLENNKDVDDIEIFILDLGISEERKEIIRHTVDRYQRKAHFILVEDSTILGYLGREIPKHIGSYATYARICAPVVYPDYVDRIICIDSDMIVAGSLKEIYNCDMNNKVVAAVPVRYADYGTLTGSSKEESEIVALHQYYVNNGFLMLNLKNWKILDFERRIKQAVSALKTFKHKDQTILNYALDDQLLKPLSPSYNYWLHKLPKFRLRLLSEMRPYDVEEAKEAMVAPRVIHYVSEIARPWYKENISLMANCYYQYKAMSAYKEWPLESLFDSPSYKDRSCAEKVFLRLYLKSYHNPFFGRLMVSVKKIMSN